MFNPGFGSNQTPNNGGNNSNTPNRKIISTGPGVENQLPPVETLNPDTLKDLNKLQLQAYLKAYQIIPAVSKPEMKKQMRTLIHSITNKEPIQQQQQQQPQQQMQTPQQQMQPQMFGGGPMVGVGNLFGGIPQGYPGTANIAPVQQQIQQHLQQQQAQYQQQVIQQYQAQQAQAQYQAQQAQIQQQLIQQQAQQQAALLAQQQLIAQQQAAQQAAAAQAAALAAQQTAQEANLKSKKKSSATSTPAVVEKDATKAPSPPHSPRTKEAQSKELVGGEQCVECKSKKSNKECNNRRCRGCCIKYMIDKKSHICFLHLRDESRRPRIKDPAQTDIIQDLIDQASKELPAGTRLDRSEGNSLSNTPSISSTPLLGSSKTNSPILSSEQQSDSMNPLSLEQQNAITTTTVQPPQLLPTLQTQEQPSQQQPQQIPTIQQPPPQLQMPPPPPIQQPIQQQQIQQPPQQQQQQGGQNKNDSFGRKIQSYYNNHFIGVQAQVAACSNPKRLTPYKDDRYSFFSCYKCDKVISVNGFQLWRHIQSEHTEDFFKFLKENINSQQTISSMLFNSDSIYNNTKQKTNERFSLIIDWLQEVFSPIPPPEITDKTFLQERVTMLLEFESKLNSLFDSLATTSSSTSSKLLKDYEKYSLASPDSCEEFQKIVSQYDNEHQFEPIRHPLLVKPSTGSSLDGVKVSAFQFIESDSSFSLQSL